MAGSSSSCCRDHTCRTVDCFARAALLASSPSLSLPALASSCPVRQLRPYRIVVSPHAPPPPPPPPPIGGRRQVLGWRGPAGRIAVEGHSLLLVGRVPKQGPSRSWDLRPAGIDLLVLVNVIGISRPGGLDDGDARQRSRSPQSPDWTCHNGQS